MDGVEWQAEQTGMAVLPVRTVRICPGSLFSRITPQSYTPQCSTASQQVICCRTIDTAPESVSVPAKCYIEV